MIRLKPGKIEKVICCMMRLVVLKGIMIYSDLIVGKL